MKKRNQELNPEEARVKIEQTAVRLLHRREHSAKELEIKLMQRGFNKSDIEPVLSLLQNRKWQSDDRFVESFIHGRISRGYGELRIKAELQQKGITSKEVDEAFSALETDWFEMAEQLYRNRFNSPPADIKEKQKRMRFMFQRGFNQAQVSPLLELEFDDYI